MPSTFDPKNPANADKDGHAKALITLNLTLAYLSRIRNKDSAATTWKTLKDHFSYASKAQALQYRKELNDLKMCLHIL
jgi:hypothetical protein